MQVNQVMTPDVVVARPDLSVREAARKMREMNVGALPVGENDRLVGIVTDRDIVLRAVADGRDLQLTSVGEVMSANLVYCYDHQDLDEAVQIMEYHRIRRLPVISLERRLVGILSLADISTRSGNVRLAGEVAREISQPQ